MNVQYLVFFAGDTFRWWFNFTFQTGDIAQMYWLHLRYPTWTLHTVVSAKLQHFRHYGNVCLLHKIFVGLNNICWVAVSKTSKDSNTNASVSQQVNNQILLSTTRMRTIQNTWDRLKFNVFPSRKTTAWLLIKSTKLTQISLQQRWQATWETAKPIFSTINWLAAFFWWCILLFTQ